MSATFVTLVSLPVSCPPHLFGAENYPSLRAEALTYILELARESGKRIKMMDDNALILIKPREGILKHSGTTRPEEQAAVLQDGCGALNDYITQQRVREMKDIKGRLQGKHEQPGTRFMTKANLTS